MSYKTSKCAQDDTEHIHYKINYYLYHFTHIKTYEFYSVMCRTVFWSQQGNVLELGVARLAVGPAVLDPHFDSSLCSSEISATAQALLLCGGGMDPVLYREEEIVVDPQYEAADWGRG